MLELTGEPQYGRLVRQTPAGRGKYETRTDDGFSFYVNERDMLIRIERDGRHYPVCHVSWVVSFEEVK